MSAPSTPTSRSSTWTRSSQTGDKRVRRRKVVAGVGVAAVAAAVAAAFTLVPGVFDSDSSKPPAVGQPDGQQQRLGPFAEQRPTYGIGSIIQYGNDQLTVAPHTMRSLVQNDDGFAFVSTDGDVYFTDGETTEQIGDRGIVENTDIRADGSYVAWVDYTPDAPELVVYNTAAGEEVLRTAEGSLPEREMDDPYRQTTTIVDIDGGTVYWHNSIGIVATDMESLETETLNENAYPEFVHDVQNGVFSYVTDEGGVLGVGPNRDSKEAVFQADRGIAVAQRNTRVRHWLRGRDQQRVRRRVRAERHARQRRGQRHLRQLDRRRHLHDRPAQRIGLQWRRARPPAVLDQRRRVHDAPAGLRRLQRGGVARRRGERRQVGRRSATTRLPSRGRSPRGGSCGSRS